VAVVKVHMFPGNRLLLSEERISKRKMQTAGARFRKPDIVSNVEGIQV
jgi:hypothetical protein